MTRSLALLVARLAPITLLVPIALASACGAGSTDAEGDEAAAPEQIGASGEGAALPPASSGDPLPTTDPGAADTDADANGDADATPPAAEVLVGWAAVAGNGVTTTTGGGNAAKITVTNLAQFNAAANNATAAVIEVSGTVTGNMRVGSNKTIYGLPGSKLKGYIALNGSVNVIMRDLVVEGYNCTDTSSCGNGADAITVRQGAHHVWFDHLDVSDGSDGNLDIVSESDFITVSWTRFSYSADRAPNTGHPHRYCNLVGSSPTATNDAGKLRVTFHHNWWTERVDGRMPQVRYGRVHVFNNLTTATANNNSVVAGHDANIRLENSVFIGTKDPHRLNTPSAATVLSATGNSYTNTVSKHEQRNANQVFTPPYPYTLDAVATVEAKVKAGVGPRW
jgi:pectate lyase